MKNIDQMKAAMLSTAEIKSLKGGMDYYIGKTKVTREIYKDYCACHGVSTQN